MIKRSSTGFLRVATRVLLEIWPRGKSSEGRPGQRSKPCELMVAQVIVGIICLVDTVFRESLDAVYSDLSLRTDRHIGPPTRVCIRPPLIRSCTPTVHLEKL